MSYTDKLIEFHIDSIERMNNKIDSKLRNFKHLHIISKSEASEPKLFPEGIVSTRSTRLAGQLDDRLAKVGFAARCTHLQWGIWNQE